MANYQEGRGRNAPGPWDRDPDPQAEAEAADRAEYGEAIGAEYRAERAQRHQHFGNLRAFLQENDLWDKNPDGSPRDDLEAIWKSMSPYSEAKLQEGRALQLAQEQAAMSNPRPQAPGNGSYSARGYEEELPATAPRPAPYAHGSQEGGGRMHKPGGRIAEGHKVPVPAELGGAPGEVVQTDDYAWGGRGNMTGQGSKGFSGPVENSASGFGRANQEQKVYDDSMVFEPIKITGDGSGPIPDGAEIPDDPYAGGEINEYESQAIAEADDMKLQELENRTDRLLGIAQQVDVSDAMDKFF